MDFFVNRFRFSQGIYRPHDKQAHPVSGAQVANGDGAVHVHQHTHGEGAVTTGRLGGAGSHVHVLPERLTTLARPQGRHTQGALPEDWRHQAGDTHRSSL